MTMHGILSKRVISERKGCKNLEPYQAITEGKTFFGMVRHPYMGSPGGARNVLSANSGAIRTITKRLILSDTVVIRI